MSKWDGPLATLMLPNVTGGANWQGGSFDPETGLFYIFTNTGISDLGLVPGERGKSDMRFVRGQAPNPENPKAPPMPLTVQGLPLVKPPYGRITALDLKTGDDGLADRARRDARQHPQPSGAQGRDHSAHRPAGPASARW